MSEAKTKKLWKWFVSHEKKIRDSIENESVAEQQYITEKLNNFILDLGMFTWEISPGITSLWSLTISPNGDKDLLDKSKEIMTTSPVLEKWEFNSSKVARDWDRKFILYDNFMDEQEISASNWKYVALKDKEGMHALVLEANNIKHLDKETALKAANIVITNEIGEEDLILKISSVDIVPQLESDFNSQKNDIIKLKQLLIKN